MNDVVTAGHRRRPCVGFRQVSLDQLDGVLGVDTQLSDWLTLLVVGETAHGAANSVAGALQLLNHVTGDVAGSTCHQHQLVVVSHVSHRFVKLCVRLGRLPFSLLYYAKCPTVDETWCVFALLFLIVYLLVGILRSANVLISLPVRAYHCSVDVDFT